MTMKVEAIESNNQRRSCLLPMAQGAIIGTGVGYGVKYAYPVTKDEKSTPEYRRFLKEINEKRDTFGLENKSYIEGMQSKKKMSIAERAFINMYKDKKEGDRLDFKWKRENLLPTYNKLKNKPEIAEEFKEILRDAKSVAENNIKRSVNAYNHATKAIRSTAFFITTGAVAGAFIALVNDILRTDVKQH